MNIQFNIHYQTVPGENLLICGPSEALGRWDANNAIHLNYSEDGYWSLTMEIPEGLGVLEYNYLLIDDRNDTYWEWGESRKIEISNLKTSSIIVNDVWRSPTNEEKVIYSSAFRRLMINEGNVGKPVTSRAKKMMQFTIQVPRIGNGYQVCVLGNQKKLGNWSKAKPLLLACGDDFPTWKGSINAGDLSFPVQYKYGIYDIKNKAVITIEEGNDRQINFLPDDENEFLFIKSDESFLYPLGNWKGAGVSVPVFSLRSNKGFGVGDFSDLIDFIDWSKQAGMKMVQLLPVNETIASHNWLDSYPYKSISVMALHPIYMNLDKLGKLEDEKMEAEFIDKQNELNNETHVDYPEVLKYKSKYFKLIFDQVKDTFFETDEYLDFFYENKDWLVPYAAFVYLRDRMKNPDYRTWKEFSTYNPELITFISQPGTEEWDDIAIHYFIQYHLNKQLKEVAYHARNNGIVLKGDIPIGISPNSVEAWTEPDLFHLEAQAGAPPDDFAVKGQNWGFPTYNWDKMAEDNYRWWKERLMKMADYFDAYRIDHILGFFRIWEIPANAVEGVLGYFSPALPLSADEIKKYGVDFNYERMVKPYIRHHLLQNIFGNKTDDIIEQFLVPAEYGEYSFKERFNTQKKINEHFLNSSEEEELADEEREIRDNLFNLLSNVIFIQTGHDEWHPRISVHLTSSFEELDGHTRHQINRLYIDFFYERHDDFWYYEGMEKLPAIINASNMLVCGEDLGMVPECVPPVMDRLNILSLEIQRMPRSPKVKFAHPSDAPYLSVCTTSTHDMPTMRGWWEENRDMIQLFYNNELGNDGEAPIFAEPWICQQIITQHMYSPAMWTTFPIQDLMAMDGNLRWLETQEEQINQPGNVRHKWRYRMRQSIEDLKNADDFNKLLNTLIKESGRDSDY